ncbi:MAG: thiopurine S-methyltransferase [Gammaproteobacteria bacterium]|nr:thiopurine S-methyltransferase [Gammaproteobacteria bacterium]
MSDRDASLRGPNNNWLERWERQDIGWHHAEYNPHLLNYWQMLEVPEGALVLVPLCGKSRDMVWLTEQDYRVRGIELSPLAVETFFKEQGLQPKRESLGHFERWSAGPYEIYCGDIFDLDQLDNSQVNAVYDRASLVALNPLQRMHYGQLLKHVLPAGCPILLVALDYSQHEMTGPPYSVDESEVRDLFRSVYRVNQLDSLDLHNQSERYKEQGLSRIFEQIYQLQPLVD